MAKYLFTSESVTEGHPDKICDQISDAVLDAILEKDPDGRVACETAVTTGMVLVMGEISTDFYVDMAGEAVRYSQEERTENHVIVVQLVTVLVCFPLLHALGSRSGIFPAFFPTVRREKAGRN